MCCEMYSPNFCILEGGAAVATPVSATGGFSLNPNSRKPKPKVMCNIAPNTDCVFFYMA